MMNTFGGEAAAQELRIRAELRTEIMKILDQLNLMT
jgi:predicted XRE-type DNA-binding protein